MGWGGKSSLHIKINQAAVRFLRRIGIVFRAAAEQHQQLADVLHQLRTGGRAQCFANGDALHAVIAEHAHFNQFVGVQGLPRFGNHGIGQTLLPHHHHRIQVVGARFEFGYFLFGQ